MHAKLKQQISPCRKKKKRYSHKKLLSEKSTTIEKSICPFSLLYTYLYKKYLEDQEKKQSKFIIQTYIQNEHRFMTQLRLRCSDRQNFEKYHPNPSQVINVKTDNDEKSMKKSWLMLRLITNYKVKKIMEDYKKEKLKTFGKNKIILPLRQVKKKNFPCKTTYDNSDLCMKSLIHKIQQMIRVSRTINVLDELNEQSKIKSKIVLTEEKQVCEKKQKFFKNIINEYGIIKYTKTKERESKKPDRKSYSQRKSSRSSLKKNMPPSHKKKKKISSKQNRRNLSPYDSKNKKKIKIKQAKSEVFR